MTSKLTRERLEKIKSWRETYGAGSNVMLPAEEAEELARIALAAMDSKSVAWTWHYREQWHVTNDERRAEFVAKDGDVAVLPLYRQAQPELEHYSMFDVVASILDGIDRTELEDGWWETSTGAESGREALEKIRAAMLQASPVCTCPSGDGSLRWPCPVHPGNPPVIPDGYVMVPVEPNGDMLAAAQDAYGETDGDIASTLRAAMLAAAPQEVK
ncbi:TPA: hypothetical protein L9L60_002046 [Klebsiella pneumoniae]|nr:hypothetical protein [Klebsiella pneumoniae]